MLLAQRLQGFRNADGGDRDARGGERHAGAVAQDADGFEHVLVIVERLADAHEDDAVDLGTEAQNLLDDFAGPEIALEPRLARGAEAACEGAADLGGHARGEAIVTADEHGFDGVAIGQREEEFFRPRAALSGAQGEAAQLHALLIGPAAQGFGKIGVGREEIAIGNGPGRTRVEALERGAVEIEGERSRRGARRSGRCSGENGGSHGASGGSECRLYLRPAIYNHCVGYYQPRSLKAAFRRRNPGRDRRYSARSRSSRSCDRAPPLLGGRGWCPDG